MLVMAVSVGVRIVVALALGLGVGNHPALYDEVSYHELAGRVLSGDGFSFGRDAYPFTPAETPTAHWSFAYPVFLASVYGIVGDQPVAARIVQAVLIGTLLPLVGMWWGTRLGGSHVGRIAAAWLALYPMFVYFGSALMTEAFATGIILVSLCCMIVLAERPGLRVGLVTGGLLGLGALLRQTSLVAGLAGGLWLLFSLGWRRSWTSLVGVVFGVAFVVCPWTVRNYQVFGRPLLLNSNAGYALYASNHPGHGWNYDWSLVPSIPRELVGLNEAEIDTALVRRVLAEWRQSPARAVVLTISKLDDFWLFWPLERSGAVSDAARMLSLGIALPFAVAGVIQQRSRSETSLVVLFIVMYSGIHLLSWPGHRYRQPIDAVLVVYAAAGLSDCIGRWRERQAHSATVA